MTGELGRMAHEQLRTTATRQRALEVRDNHSRTVLRRIRWLIWWRVCVHCGERSPCRQRTWALDHLGVDR